MLRNKELKEIERATVLAWSRAADGNTTSLLALGTVAGSLNADFSTSASVELVRVNWADPSPAMTVVGSASAPDKLHKLAWGGTAGTHGVLAGALQDGSLVLWDPAKLLEKRGDAAALSVQKKHTAAVLTVDFNPLSPNLLASGGADGELLVWDVARGSCFAAGGGAANATAAVAGGARGELLQVAWNRRVEAILAAVAAGGASTVVWHLKDNKPILAFHDQKHRASRVRALAWHPTESTQLVTASDDDQQPALLLWDLRNTYAPTRVFTGHRKGVWALSWNAFEPALLASVGKDSCTLLWDMRTGAHKLAEELSATAWNFEVQWAPRPGTQCVLATCSLQNLGGCTACTTPIPPPLPAPAPADAAAAATAASAALSPFDAIVAAQQQQQQPPPHPGAARAAGGPRPVASGRAPRAPLAAAGGGLCAGLRRAARAVRAKGVRVARGGGPGAERARVLQEALGGRQQYAALCQSRAAAGGPDATVWRFVLARLTDDRRALLQLLGFRAPAPATPAEAPPAAAPAAAPPPPPPAAPGPPRAPR